MKRRLKLKIKKKDVVDMILFCIMMAFSEVVCYFAYVDAIGGLS